MNTVNLALFIMTAPCTTIICHDSTNTAANDAYYAQLHVGGGCCCTVGGGGGDTLGFRMEHDWHKYVRSISFKNNCYTKRTVVSISLLSNRQFSAFPTYIAKNGNRKSMLAGCNSVPISCRSIQLSCTKNTIVFVSI